MSGEGRVNLIAVNILHCMCLPNHGTAHMTCATLCVNYVSVKLGDEKRKGGL